MKTATKPTEQVSTSVVFTRYGHACNGPVAWESPFVVFTLQSGRQILWHSTEVNRILRAHGFPHPELAEGRWVHLTARLRGDRVQRILSIVDL